MNLMITIVAVMVSLPSFALEMGAGAPEFKLSGTIENKNVSLSDFKGKYVVLEWLNHGCPFVRKHYDSGNMPALQKKYTAMNVIWLSIISSAPGKQGHVDAREALKDKTKYKSAATDILLDITGQVGKTYEAKTTPHMAIIDKSGKLVYQGAIDNTPEMEIESIKDAKNYVALALDSLLAGKKILVPKSTAYGCSVKY